MLSLGWRLADDTFQQCVNRAVDHGGEPPTCTKVNGQWVASWPDSSSSGGGNGAGAFVLMLVIGVLVAAAVTYWKVTTAQRLARQSGMDPALATQMTLLSDDGLDATYLASSLRLPPVAPPIAHPIAPPATGRAPVAERLTELAALRDQGLVTQEEYDERRRAIIDSV